MNAVPPQQRRRLLLFLHATPPGLMGALALVPQAPLGRPGWGRFDGSSGARRAAAGLVWPALDEPLRSRLAAMPPPADQHFSEPHLLRVSASAGFLTSR